MAKSEKMTTIWAYPWDIVEAGPGQAAGEIAQTGLSSISLATTYHAFDMLRPHGMGNRLLKVRSSAAYYPFNPASFSDGQLVPNRSTLVTGEQWSECSIAAQEAGLQVVAWTIFLHNSYLAGGHPQFAQITCTGDRLDHQLCPMQPQVRKYALALAADICSASDVDVLECEGLSFGGFGHTHYHPKIGLDLGSGGRFLFSLCFCNACMAEAEAANIDVVAIRAKALEATETIFESGEPNHEKAGDLIAADPELAAFARLRDASVTELVRSVVNAAQKPVRILAMGDRHTTALDIAEVAPFVDSVEYLCYSPDPERLRHTIVTAEEETGSATKVGVGLQAYPPASPDSATLGKSVEVARICGAGLISFYNYGIMPKRNLSWIAQSLGSAS
jgi:hypothetical protein